MIQDFFETIKLSKGDPEDVTGQMRCKRCSKEFDVRFFILRPVNVNFMLGESVSVICPGCGIHGTTTEKERKVRTLEAQIARLKTQLGPNTEPKPFQSFRSRVIDEQLHLTCINCGKEAASSFDGCGWLKYVRDERTGMPLAQITCPSCGATDTMSKEDVSSKVSELSLVAQIKLLEHELRAVQKDDTAVEN